MNTSEPERLKQLTIVALFSDDQLVNRLVLKGGNALSLAYNLTSRASFDLDFSIEGTFELGALADIKSRIEFRLSQAFKASGYVVFDVRLEPKPEKITPDLEDFWGGYGLDFKVISIDRYNELEGALHAIRREAIRSRPGGKARFEVDISKHEYCSGKQAVEIEGFTVHVYTPLMVVYEKIRAICQQSPTYVAFVRKHRAPRARDFFDIDQICRRFDLDLSGEDNLEILRNIFGAKRVPLELLLVIEQEREFHRQNWNAVIDTVDLNIQLDEFDVYFDFAMILCRRLATALKC